MPKSITLDKFSKGLNLQQGPSTSSADTLRVLKNAYVSAGKSIRKRPGFTLVASLEPGLYLVRAAGLTQRLEQFPIQCT